MFEIFDMLKIHVRLGVPFTSLMSRIERTSKNLQANWFRKFGEKDLKETAVTNV